MITDFKLRTTIIYSINIYKILDGGSIFTWFLAKTIVQADRLSDKLLIHEFYTSKNSIILKKNTFTTKINLWAWEQALKSNG